MTERLLTDAGISAGMRVLDVGCGRGDVSFMAARLVGTSGQVVGIDKDPDPLVVARERAREAKLLNVSFETGDLAAFAAGGRLFDAIVGRRVLTYQLDPVSAIRLVSTALRPGCLAIFQEHDATPASGSRTPLPLHQRVQQWIWDTVTREGANIHMGFELPSALTEAGLTLEHVRAEAIVQTPQISYPTHDIVRAILPRIVKEGVATEKEIDIETLGERLMEERVHIGATYVGETVFGAWARKSQRYL